MTLPRTENAPIWELEAITKRFAGITANEAISLKLHAGEIHGLVGENGCGKSTLIKILSGAHQPDAGRILRGGQPVRIPSPIAAREAGISTVFQEFSVVPTLTVAENVYLGRWPRKRGKVDWVSMREGAGQVLADMEVAINSDAVVSSLSVAEQQMVEIAKALASDATMLILDEPTTALGLSEIERLHGLLRKLKSKGVAILYISHRLDEVVELVDKITVLKEGKVVASAEESIVSIAFIVKAMVGEVGEHYPKEQNAQDDIVLSVSNLSTANRVNCVSFDVRRGEVLGLGGVLGSGRTEIARALFGMDKRTAGSIVWKGHEVTFSTPRQAIAAGFALVPENRKFDGLFFNFTGFPNFSAAALDKLGHHGLIRLARETQAGRKLIIDLEVTPTAENKTVDLLSGGNQQKIIIGRWLFADAELFILDEPTQGIDIGAKIAVYQLINQLTRAGKSIILISSDHDELLAMSDRVAVIAHGKVIDVRPAHAVAKTDLVKAAGVTSPPATEKAA